MLTADQWIISIGLFIVILLAVAWISWDSAVWRHNKNAKARDKKLEETSQKYESIVKKLEEDPQAYAVGLGALYAIQTIEATTKELREAMGLNPA